jgi:hypothetical protein
MSILADGRFPSGLASPDGALPSIPGLGFFNELTQLMGLSMQSWVTDVLLKPSLLLPPVKIIFFLVPNQSVAADLRLPAIQPFVASGVF